MAYSTIPKGSLYMNTKLYTGNATNPTTISGIGFQPDWVWTKSRSATEGHRLCDAVRGATKDLFSNTTSAESTNTIGLKSFNSDGYVIGNSNGYNQNSQTFVSWNWKANGQGSSNTDGSINTTYTSVNTTAGFSISKYTGNSTTGATVGHGLGATPKMIIIKSLGVENWEVYHASLGNTQGIYLNETNAAFTTSARWNNTSPTNSVWTMGNTSAVNASGVNYIAYCFAEKQGYSKFGSYTGNGNADGTFVYTGFKPAFVMVKLVSAAGEDWFICDNKREGYNAENNRLLPNLNSAESTDSPIDIVSNGFKARTSGANVNAGEDYLYMAFAENPFVATSGTSAVPVTAR